MGGGTRHSGEKSLVPGRNAEAETLLRELIRAHEKVLGARVYLLENNVSSRVDELDTLTPLEGRTLFANTLRDQGKYAEAEASTNRSSRLRRTCSDPNTAIRSMPVIILPTN